MQAEMMPVCPICGSVNTHLWMWRGKNDPKGMWVCEDGHQFYPEGER